MALHDGQQLLQRQAAAWTPAYDLLDQPLDILTFPRLEQSMPQPGILVAQLLVSLPYRRELLRVSLRRELLHQLQIAASDRSVITVVR